jgi:hypothetical protein
MGKRDPHSLAREYGEEAIEIIRGEMLTADESRDRLKAAEMILDRGYGKAAQAIIAIPAQRQQLKAAALYSDVELSRIIDAEFKDLEPDSPAALIAIEDPLLA